MKNLKLIAVFIVTIIFLNCSENKKNENDEQEIRDLITSYDEAAVKNDIGFFEANVASDYYIATSQGGFENRENTLKYIKEDIEKPTYKLVSLKSDSVQFHIIGDAAGVSGKSLSTTQAMDVPKSLVDDDEVGSTSSLEKRDGRWIMWRDHVTQNALAATTVAAELLAARGRYGKGLI